MSSQIRGMTFGIIAFGWVERLINTLLLHNIFLDNNRLQILVEKNPQKMGAIVSEDSSLFLSSTE